jgi:hypothetical protein
MEACADGNFILIFGYENLESETLYTTLHLRTTNRIIQTCSLAQNQIRFWSSATSNQTRYWCSEGGVTCARSTER